MTDLFKQFVDKWTSPSIVILILTSVTYCTIWLVKLDNRVFNQNEHISTQEERHVRDINRVEVGLDKAIRKLEAHNREAEEWKRRILLNEIHNKNGHPGE